MNPLLLCGALWTSVVPDPMGGAGSSDCLAVGASMAGRFERHWPSGGVDRALTLPRARLSLGLEQQDVGARVILGTVRSGGEDSYIGVDGEALVPRVEVAEARLKVPELGLVVAGGLVDDLWVVSSNLAWGHRAVAAGFAEESGWQDRSDIGGTLAWTSLDAWTSVAVSTSTGEGLARRERNTGLNTSALVVARPLTSAVAPNALEVTVFARDGSRGLGLARDHRLGGRMSSAFGPVQGAVEHLRTYGVGADSLREPRGSSVWVAVAPGVPLTGLVRFDRIDESVDYEGDLTHVLRVAAGVPWPLQAEQAPARMMALVERYDRQVAVTQLAGARAEREHLMVGLHLEVNLQGAVATTPIDPLARP